MSLSEYGANRFLSGVMGESVTGATASTIRAKLHTGDTPTAGNELSGNGYSDVTVALSQFTKANVSSFRELRFPELEFFATAGGAAQTARSIALWHGTNLVWHDPVVVVPNNQRVYSPALNTHIDIQRMSAVFNIENDTQDDGLEALAGAAKTAKTLNWYLHSGVPVAGNILTGGGITGTPLVTWTRSTVGNFRRLTGGETVFPSTGTLSGATDTEPTHLALWEGNPAASGTLRLWKTIVPVGTTAENTRIIFPDGELQFEISLAAA